MMLRNLCAAVAAATVALLVPTAAADAIKLTSVDGGFVDGVTGTTLLQAGSHPDYRIRMTFPAQPGADPGLEILEEAVRNVEVALPAGMVGNPQAVGSCSRRELMARWAGNAAGCPTDSQVGVVNVQTGADPAAVWESAVFNLDRPAGKPAEFGFNALGAVVRFAPRVRAGDYRLVVDARDASQALQIFGIDMTMWGVPADPVHDAKRWDPDLYGNGWFGASPTSSRKPFLTLPTTCTGSPLTTDIRADSWQATGVFTSGSFSSGADGAPLVLTGCEKLDFAPSVDTAPTSRVADAPTGFEVDVQVPQNSHPDGLATAHVKDVSMVLPEGVSVSPSSAVGLAACSPAEIGLGSDAPATCPRASKLGTVTVETPLLVEPLTGDVFLATPDSNPFGSLVALYIVAEGSGVRIKLPGRVDTHQVTGQLTATFSNNPQLPFSALKVRFDGGENASLATPTECGRYDTKTAITSWSGKTVNLTSPLTIDQSCGPRGFTPAISAGSMVPLAAKDSTFVLNIARGDRQQNLSQVTTVLPAGMLARIKDVPVCSDVAANAGTCSDASLIGSVRTTAGPGSAPLPVNGRVHLTGPHNGGPYGLAIIVPTAGQAGPFDLGNVVVRARITVDRKDGHVEVVADPMPTILRGFPLRVRSVNVAIDRPGFTFNPTNCSQKSVDTAVRSVEGTVANASSRFQVNECAALAFDPELAMSVGTVKKSAGGAARTPAEMVDGGHPALSARVAMNAGRANNGKATVALPLSLALDPDNANGLCEPVDAARNSCPAASIVGNAKAVTPLLTGTVDGPVYFVRGERTDPKSGRIIKTLPKLFVPLTSSENPLVKIDLHASSEVKDDRLVTTFDNLPDVPISTFDLKINGGKNGILVVSNTNACASAQYTDNVFTGQNGKRYISKTGLATACPLSVVKSSHSASALNLTLGGLAPGKVTVTGTGLRKKAKTIPVARPQVQDEGRTSTIVTVSATTHTRVVVPMSRSVRRSLAAGRDVKVKVTVGFKAHGAKQTVNTTKTITIHAKKK